MKMTIEIENEICKKLFPNSDNPIKDTNKKIQEFLKELIENIKGYPRK